MTTSTPNVNFFVHYVPNLDGKSLYGKNISKYEKERKFYGCKDSYNYVEYVHNGSKEQIDYVSYSGNNEKSSGVFTEKGLLDKEEKLELKHQLANTKSPIWHGLVSFEEMFGKTKCNTYEMAYELMKTEFPKFLKNAGLDPKNIVWFAGLHENTDHRHIHFSFFEKEPTKYRKNHEDLQFSNGKLPLKAIEKAKIDIELRLNGWNERFKDVRQNIQDEVKKYFYNNDYSKEIQREMRELKFMLPLTGRLQYDSENMVNVRPQINYIVDKYVQSNPYLLDEFNKFLDYANEKDILIAEMCKKSKVNPEDYLLKAKLKQDLYRRLGNQVLRSLDYLTTHEKILDSKSKGFVTKKRIQKAKKMAELQECIILARTIETEAINCFKEYYEKLQEFEYENLRDEGVID